MLAHEAMLIRVQSDWNGWRTADVCLGDLQDVHWLQPAGALHALLHARVLCSRIVAGAIPHVCDRRSAPHRLLVCILKSHTLPVIYEELARRAGERRTWPLTGGEGIASPRSSAAHSG